MYRHKRNRNYKFKLDMPLTLGQMILSLAEEEWEGETRICWCWYRDPSPSLWYHYHPMVFQKHSPMSWNAPLFLLPTAFPAGRWVRFLLSRSCSGCLLLFGLLVWLLAISWELEFGEGDVASLTSQLDGDLLHSALGHDPRSRHVNRQPALPSPQRSLPRITILSAAICGHLWWQRKLDLGALFRNGRGALEGFEPWPCKSSKLRMKLAEFDQGHDGWVTLLCSHGNRCLGILGHLFARLGLGVHFDAFV